MNCLYITLFFNTVAGNVQTFINLGTSICTPESQKSAACRLNHVMTSSCTSSSSSLNFLPARCFFRWRNKWKSLGVRSGLYSGWSNIPHLNFSRSAVVTCAKWGHALSRSRHTPRYNIPLLLFWMARRSRVKVSQYAAALIVVPGGMKSTRRMPFLSQKMDTMIFLIEIEVFNFLILGECIWCHCSDCCLDSGVVKNPCFIFSHNGVQKIISFLCVAREKLQCGTHLFCFVIVR